METCPEEGAAYRITEYIHVPGIMYASKCAFIGTNGLPVVGKKSGWASMTFDYNEDYSMVTYHYFGTNDLPIPRPGGYWAYRIYEDKYEFETNMVFLDDKDLPVMHSSLGYASRSKTYDYSWETCDKDGSKEK